jgi:mannobiose 2-epimerase
MADRALSFLLERFHDPRRMGWFWLVAPNGRPLDRQKHLYGQAFAIHGLSEYTLAFGGGEALTLARDTFDAVDHHGHDSEHGGYRQSFSLDWSPTPGRRHLGAMGHQKTTNTHIHLLESLATLYRVSQDVRVGTRLRELIDLFTTTIFDRSRGCTHEIFERDWTPSRSTKSFGHDIETSWLLTDACESVGIRDASSYREVSLLLARTAARMGLDPRDGGIFHGANPAGRVTDRRKVWWVQADALVGFLNAYALSGHDGFLDTFLGVERWVFARQVDTQYGEWHHTVGPWGRIRGAKASIWKTPYHTVRACIELVRRCRRLAHPAA